MNIHIYIPSSPSESESSASSVNPTPGKSLDMGAGYRLLEEIVRV